MLCCLLAVSFEKVRHFQLKLKNLVDTSHSKCLREHFPALKLQLSSLAFILLLNILCQAKQISLLSTESHLLKGLQIASQQQSSCTGASHHLIRIACGFERLLTSLKAAWAWEILRITLIARWFLDGNFQSLPSGCSL